MALVKTDHVIPPQRSTSHLWILDSWIDRDEITDHNYLQISVNKLINNGIRSVFKYVKTTLY